MEETVWFKTICRKNHYPVSDEQTGLLQRYVECLLDWNKKLNLISRRDEGRVWSQHVLASIALLFRYELLPGSSLIDIGTGGGLPGIPLRILARNLSVTLLDSIQKKVRAVGEIISDLKLDGLTAVCARVEEVNRKPPLHESFDYVIARGVGTITDIVKWGAPLLKPTRTEGRDPEMSATRVLERGSLILLKGGDLEQETDQARIRLNPREIKSYPLVVDGADPQDLVDKKIVIIRP